MPLHIWWKSMLEWKVQIPVISLLPLNAQCAKDSKTLQQIPWSLGTREDGLFIRLEFLRCYLYSLKNILRGTCCGPVLNLVLVLLHRQAGKFISYLIPISSCYSNASWFRSTHAAAEELKLHTAFCTGWASWKTVFNREHLLRLLLSQLCQCCIQGCKGLGLFPLVAEGGYTNIILFGIFLL